MTPYLLNAGVFLIRTVFGFLIVVFLLRAMLIGVGASFNEPLVQFVYRITNPVITPLRRIVPRWRKLELASLLLAWLFVTVATILLLALYGLPIRVVSLARAFMDVLDWIVLIELAAILAYCVLSFIPSMRYDANFRLLARFIEPVVRPFQRLLPPLGGFDFSCWFASIALILVRMLVIAPLADAAMIVPW